MASALLVAGALCAGALPAESARAQPADRVVVAHPFASEPPVVAAAMRCPDDLVLPCAGTDNDALWQAWLDSFAADPSPGCGQAALSLQVSPGALIASISHDDFADLSDFTLNGATSRIGNPVLSNSRRVLRLTDNLGQSGSAFVTNPVTLDLDASFSAFFSFQISNPMGSSDNDGIGADGLVFVVQTVANTAGGVGGGIGYEGIPRSFGVEFDTYNNGTWDDFNGNHVGINLSGAIDSVVQANIPQRLNDGAICFAWVDYDGVRDEIQVRLSLTPGRPVDPLLTYVTDLASVLASPDAFVGFTSGTGSAGNFHDILSFYFVNTQQPADCGGGQERTVLASVIDDCANTAACARVAFVTDQEAPALSSPPVTGCFASAAEAEAAALAGSSATDACSPPARLAATTTGACDGIVRVTASDDCGNTSFVDHAVRIVDPLFMGPADPSLACGDAIHVPSGPGDVATVNLGVVLAGGCEPLVVSNDHTSGGADASGEYPCGFTVVTFDAVDACAQTRRCRVGVSVDPAPVSSVGAALRVTKNAASAPRLDWTLAPPEAGPWFAVLQGAPNALPSATGLSGRTWTDPSPDGWLIFYDVRSQDCAAGLSAD